MWNKYVITVSSYAKNFQIKIVLGYTFIVTIRTKALKQTNNVLNLIISFNKYKIVLYVLIIQYLCTYIHNWKYSLVIIDRCHGLGNRRVLVGGCESRGYQRLFAQIDFAAW